MVRPARPAQSKEPMTAKDNPLPLDPRVPNAEPELSLGELLANFWGGRHLLLGATFLALLFGGFYVWRKSPIYQVDALLQIEDKKGGKAGPAMVALEGLLDQPAQAKAEIEILRSNLVLGRAVEGLSLDLRATPHQTSFLGNVLYRNNPNQPEILIERFEVPGHLLGKWFRVMAAEGGSFRWEGPAGEALGTGRPGIPLQATLDGGALLLQVRRLSGKAGQRFDLVRQPMLLAIDELREDLRVNERGKMTNILGLSYEHRSPVRGAEILNEIINQYVRQNIERKAEEASKTLAFLQEQMPRLRGNLEIAEERLNQYRKRSGTVDLPEEAKLLLKQSVDLEGQVLSLGQKRQELLRTYKPGSDVVQTLDQQISKLSAESRTLESRVRGLPATQQEMVRLMRDVQVNTELYTALLNNVQQLQVAKAGEIGNARIVDHAMPSLKPIKPQKSAVMVLAGLLGLLSGTGLVLLRRALHRGVEDPRLIESRLGIPVVVTIPHSEAQFPIQKAIKQRKEGMHLLALDHSDDMAVESLRSLRTSLHFTAMDAKNPVVLISGPSPSIGKTFITSNFAAVVAQTGTRVLVVDGDLRRGALHHPFGFLERGLGLSEVLSGQAEWSKVVHRGILPSLDLITTGTLPPNPAELLMGHRLSAFIQEVSAAYDLVLIDAAPVLAVTDPVILASHVGVVLLIVKAEAHTLDEIRATLQRFQQASGTRVKGCIFNDVKSVKLGYEYYRYAYHYGYKK